MQTILESRESWRACFCITVRTRIKRLEKIAIPKFVCSWVSIWERYTDLTSCQNQSTYMDNINKRQSHMSKVHTYLGFTFRSHSLNGHRWPTFKKMTTPIDDAWIGGSEPRHWSQSLTHHPEMGCKLNRISSCNQHAGYPWNDDPTYMDHNNSSQT